MCAHVFLRFYNGCYDQLSAIATGHLDSFDALAVKCGRIAPDNSCLSDNHKAQILTDLQCAETTNNVQERLTCLSRIRGVLGLEGEGAGKSPEQCTKLSLELPLLEDTADDSGNGHTAMVHGDAFVADGTCVSQSCVCAPLAPSPVNLIPSPPSPVKSSNFNRRLFFASRHQTTVLSATARRS